MQFQAIIAGLPIGSPEAGLAQLGMHRVLQTEACTVDCSDIYDAATGALTGHESFLTNEDKTLDGLARLGCEQSRKTSWFDMMGLRLTMEKAREEPRRFFSVNISPNSAADEVFCERLSKLLAANLAHQGRNNVRLELIETAAHVPVAALVAFAKRAQGYNVKVVLDDVLEGRYAFDRLMGPDRALLDACDGIKFSSTMVREGLQDPALAKQMKALAAVMQKNGRSVTLEGGRAELVAAWRQQGLYFTAYQRRPEVNDNGLARLRRPPGYS